MTSVGRKGDSDSRMLEMFAHNRKINPSCFNYYPTKYDIKLAYANNSLGVANSFMLACGGPGEDSCESVMQYGENCRKEIKELSEMRNTELDKFHKVLEVSAIRDCMWDLK